MVAFTSKHMTHYILALTKTRHTWSLNRDGQYSLKLKVKMTNVIMSYKCNDVWYDKRCICPISSVWSEFKRVNSKNQLHILFRAFIIKSSFLFLWHTGLLYRLDHFISQWCLIISPSPRKSHEHGADRRCLFLSFYGLPCFSPGFTLIIKTVNHSSVLLVVCSWLVVSYNFHVVQV